ncbi:MAG: fimbrillin family protein [Alistipes sp.]|nr:fimbrillin family protein [Candidatus Alistipes equi]
MATKAYGTGYENIKYTYNSTKEKWTASPSIKVGSTPGYFFGYYPYDSESTDIKAIPIESSLNGDDVMYAEKVSDVLEINALRTSIMMKHALSRVSIMVKNNGYTGEAKLSKIKFSGTEIAPKGTLSALDGSITAEKRT